MSTNNTPTPSNSTPCVFQTPSKAFFARGWGKPGEKPAEKQDFAGSEEANQLAAKSLLDLVNTTDIKVLKAAMTEPDSLAKATMESVTTSPAAVTAIKRINIKRNNRVPKTIVVLFQLTV